MSSSIRNLCTHCSEIIFEDYAIFMGKVGNEKRISGWAEHSLTLEMLGLSSRSCFMCQNIWRYRNANQAGTPRIMYRSSLPGSFEKSHASRKCVELREVEIWYINISKGSPPAPRDPLKFLVQRKGNFGTVVSLRMSSFLVIDKEKMTSHHTMFGPTIRSAWLPGYELYTIGSMNVWSIIQTAILLPTILGQRGL
jgi:hypothetical protein